MTTELLLARAALKSVSSISENSLAITEGFSQIRKKGLRGER